MNRTLTLVTLALSALTISARQLSPSEALQRANLGQSSTLSIGKTSAPQLAFELNAGKTNLTALYVFDTKPGYVILSADDCAAPVLGYSDKGTFDAQNIAPALKYWLDFYASQIAWANENGVTYSAKASRAADKEPIAPMVKTTWNQSAPYNDKCPEFSGQRSVTGCVATALAQEMYFHQWPAKAQGGTVTYDSYYSSEYNTEIRLNFDDITFDWSDMLLNYTTGNYTTTQADAVAELMYACGVAVEMDYSPSESGASTYYLAPALYNYFGYSEAATMPTRAFYTSEQWEDMIYDQLAKNLPVLYGGDSTEGGHQFVCDGYQSDGYFHFNWGWAGQSDGYYLLSALDPESQGIGGSTSGYNYNQTVCINIAKPDVVTEPQYLVYCNGDFLTEGLYQNMENGGDSQTVQLGSQITLMASKYFGNYGSKTIDGAFGLLLTDASGNTTTVYGSSVSMAVLVKQGEVRSYQVTLPQTLASGTYNVTPIFLPTGASDYIQVLAPVSAINSLSMTVSGSTATITVGDAPDFAVTSAEFKSEVYSGSYFSLDFTATNSGTTQYYGLIGAILVQDGQEMASTSQVVPVTLNPGEEGTFNLIGMFENEMDDVAAGTYQVVLYDTSSGNSVGPDNNLTVTVKDALSSDPTLNVSLAVNGSSEGVDPSSVYFTGTVECESGYLANQLIMFIFPDKSGAQDIYYTYTDYMFLGEGDQTTFNLKVDLSSVVEEGGTYLAQMYTASESPLGQSVTFTVKTTGISDVENASAEFKVFPVPANDYITVTTQQPIESVAIVNLAGQTVRTLHGINDTTVTIDVDDLAAGHYFVTVATADGSTKSRHIIVD